MLRFLETIMGSVTKFLRTFATNVIRRVGARNVGIDPITITTILTTVLPMIIGCIQKRRQVQPDQVQAHVNALCGTNYAKTRKDFAAAIKTRWTKHVQKLKRAAAKSGDMFNEAKFFLSDEDALELADKALQEAHSTSSAEFTAFAASSIQTED